MQQIDYDFEWDPVKALVNINKHGVAFEQAATVFHDPLSLTVYDMAHSEEEERWLTIGQIDGGALVVVSHTFESIGSTRARVRLISARHATPNERRTYEQEPR